MYYSSCYLIFLQLFTQTADSFLLRVLIAIGSGAASCLLRVLTSSGLLRALKTVYFWRWLLFTYSGCWQLFTQCTNQCTNSCLPRVWQLFTKGLDSSLNPGCWQSFTQIAYSYLLWVLKAAYIYTVDTCLLRLLTAFNSGRWELFTQNVDNCLLRVLTAVLLTGWQLFTQGVDSCLLRVLTAVY